MDEARAFLPKVISLIDSRNVHGRLHKNTANRKKARLAAMLNKAMNSEEVVIAPKVKKAKPAVKVEEVKAEEVKVEVKAEPAKKPVAKKAPAKKPAAKAETKAAPAKKTTTAKKPAAKKAPAKKEA